jgi:hypothetical protein
MIAILVIYKIKPLQLAASQGHGLPYDVIKAQVRGNIHLLVQQQKVAGQGRRIVEIAEVVDGQLRLLWEWDYKNHAHVAKRDLKESAIVGLGERYGLAAAVELA